MQETLTPAFRAIERFDVARRPGVSPEAVEWLREFARRLACGEEPSTP